MIHDSLVWPGVMIDTPPSKPFVGLTEERESQQTRAESEEAGKKRRSIRGHLLEEKRDWPEAEREREKRGKQQQRRQKD